MSHDVAQAGQIADLAHDSVIDSSSLPTSWRMERERIPSRSPGRAGEPVLKNPARSPPVGFFASTRVTVPWSVAGWAKGKGVWA